MFPTKWIVTLCLCALSCGCGPYRIRYTMGEPGPTEVVKTQTHAHGLGLIGGGAYFFLLNQMFPALVDYTGPVDVDRACPDFREVTHYHTFGDNAGAAFLSWLCLVNVYHPSIVEFRK